MVIQFVTGKDKDPPAASNPHNVQVVVQHRIPQPHSPQTGMNIIVEALKTSLENLLHFRPWSLKPLSNDFVAIMPNRGKQALELINQSDFELKSILLGNPNIKELYINDCSHLSDYSLKLIEKLFLLTILDLANCPFTVESLNQLLDIQKKLKVLRLQQSVVPYEISHLNQLEVLKLSQCQLPSLLMESIGKLIKLEVLDLSESQLEGSGSYESIFKLSNLHTLILSNCLWVDDEFIKQILALPSLQTLDVSGCQTITSKVLEFIKNNPHLRSIRLERCSKINQIAASLLSSQKKSLFITQDHSKENDDPEELEQFLKGKNHLLSFSFTDRNVSSHDLLILKENCPNLTQLSFKQCNLNFRLDFLPPRLATLELEGCDIGDQTISEISTLRSLISLNIPYCFNLTDQFIKNNVLLLSQLEELDIRGCPFSAQVLEDLANLTNLHTLGISVNWSPISGSTHREKEFLIAITSLTHLQGLNLSYSKGISNKFLEGLSSSLSLKALNLAWCKEEKDPSLVRALNTFQDLERLDLSGCKWVSDEAVQSLVQGLHHLKELRLDFCDITVKSLKWMSLYPQLKVSVKGCLFGFNELKLLHPQQFQGND